MPEVSSSRYLVTAGWRDVPHLDPTTQAELLADTPPHLREARSEGVPSMGAGAIYPVPLSEVLCDPFAIPVYWPRAYGLDVGWRVTACVWLARDPGDRTLYAYAEYRGGEAIPSVHATAIRQRGEWIKGAIDPASRGRSQVDGQQLLTQYRELGLEVSPAINAVDMGLHLVWSLLSTQRLRIFRTLGHTQAEYRLYRRDEHGKIVKKDDHLMDALRYGVATFDAIASVRPTNEFDMVSNRASGPVDRLGGY